MAEPPAKRQRLGIANNVIISVGEDDSKQDFNVPEFFTVKSSQFMQTTLGGNWKESHEKRISLPKARVSDFEMYLEWLYTGQVVLLDRTRGRGAILVQMYLLGDFLIDDRFCNAVIEILIRGSGATDPLLLFSFEDVDSVWSETTPGSRLRTDSADLIVRDLSGDRGAPYFKRRGTWGHDVAVEVLARMAEFKLAALKIFAAIEDSTETLETIKSAVGHPKDNKNKCVDYHKHDESYPRCT